MQSKILKKGRNFRMITDLALMRILKIILVNVGQKIVVVILLEKSLDGELVKNLL